MKANNEDGSSRWSEEVCYRTLPDRPSPPSRPIVKGKVHASSFKVKWDPPHDRGGADISSYTLELGSDKGMCFYSYCCGNYGYAEFHPPDMCVAFQETFIRFTMDLKQSRCVTA